MLKAPAYYVPTFNGQLRFTLHVRVLANATHKVYKTIRLCFQIHGAKLKYDTQAASGIK